MTPATARALGVLHDYGPLRPREFARRMWPESDGWRRSCRCGPNGSHRGGGMYLAAGGYLGALTRRGLVQRYGRGAYILSDAGLAALARDRQA